MIDFIGNNTAFFLLGAMCGLFLGICIGFILFVWLETKKLQDPGSGYYNFDPGQHEPMDDSKDPHTEHLFNKWIEEFEAEYVECKGCRQFVKRAEATWIGENAYCSAECL